MNHPMYKNFGHLHEIPLVVGTLLVLKCKAVKHQCSLALGKSQLLQNNFFLFA